MRLRTVVRMRITADRTLPGVIVPLNTIVVARSALLGAERAPPFTARTSSSPLHELKASCRFSERDDLTLFR